MKVKELIRKLMLMDPEAFVCVEALDSNEAIEVKQYSYEGENVVYIADNLGFLEDDDSLLPSNTYMPTYSLDLFIEDDVPFTLTEVLGVSDEDSEKVKDELISKMCIAHGGDFDFFDYERYHAFIIDFLNKHKIEYGG